MPRFSVVLVCCSLFAVVGGSDASSHAALAVPDEVVVLAGQSNMLGRGFPLKQGEASNPSLLVWKKKTWQVAVDPLGTQQDPPSGVGPGMTFGLAAVGDLSSETVGLVMCAVSGTTISKWQPGHSAYDNCITQTSAAAGRVAGILFLQGESDAANKKDANAWASRFETVLDGFRADLGADVPFVLGQIGKIKASGFGYQKTVRSQQAAAAQAHPEIAMITTDDLKTQSDGLHFTVASYKTIGARFAAAWWALRSAVT